MDRFFVDPTQIAGASIAFSPAQAHQLSRVLRLRPGARVLVLDGQGVCHEVELTALAPNIATGVIMSTGPASGEPKVHITLYQALLKGPKWEYVLQKCTEAGVSTFVPLITERCVAEYEPKRWPERQSRWETILREAAEQSGRGRIPRLLPPVELKQAFAPPDSVRLMLHPDASRSLRTAIAASTGLADIALHVGPEGGFTDAEIASAVQSGVATVGLGARTLRAETAGVFATAALLYALGELD